MSASLAGLRTLNTHHDVGDDNDDDDDDDNDGEKDFEGNTRTPGL